MMKPTPLIQEKARRWLRWLPKPCHTPTPLGFTLAELLICVAILGVIATFTIPKIIAGQQNGQFNAVVKEDIAAISGAFQQYQNANTLSSGFQIGNLTQYINYAKVDTSSPVDQVYGYGVFTCSNGIPCLRMQNGSVIYYSTADVMAGTNTTDATLFYIDPDLTTSSSTQAPGKSVGMFLYPNGRIADYGSIATGTTTRGVTITSSPSTVPPWFSW